jgi:N-carbamoylputrescine amidase
VTSKTVRVAAIQSRLSDSRDENIDLLSAKVRAAAAGGAQIIVLPELFEGHYFPKDQREEDFARAAPAKDHPTICHFAELARDLEVVLPVSFFERDGQEFYNSVTILDADGSALGVYRKAHIPDGPGYQEKFFFRPGNTAFRCWHTRYASIGVGICWDQWFPEAARAMVLDGADILLYPTAIGSEPHDEELDTREPWQRVMVGHAVANGVAVVAANRCGTEDAMSFYGHSFICNWRGDFLSVANEDPCTLSADIDVDEMRRYRAGFGFFRDRRPELYSPLSQATSRKGGSEEG